MTIRQALINTHRDDAQRAGERDRLLLEARRANRARHQGPDHIALARRLVRLLVRRAAAAPRRFPGSPGRTGQSQVPTPISSASSPAAPSTPA